MAYDVFLSPSPWIYCALLRQTCFENSIICYCVIKYPAIICMPISKKLSAAQRTFNLVLCDIVILQWLFVIQILALWKQWCFYILASVWASCMTPLHCTSGLITLTVQGGGGSQRISPVKITLLWICGWFEDSYEQFILSLRSLNSTATSALAVAGLSSRRLICCSFCCLMPMQAWLQTIQSVTALAGCQDLTHEQNTKYQMWTAYISVQP